MRTTTWRSPLPGNYVPELDGVRAVAIALVIAVHLGLVSGGFVGVSVFFVLSGYLITSLLLDERRRTGEIALKSFYVRRLGRLYPALIVMVAIGIAVGFALRGSPVTIAVEAFLVLTYTSNLFTTATGVLLPVMNPAWTLAQEEQFYLVAPFALRRIRPALYRRTAAVLIVIAAVLGAGRLIALLVAPGQWERHYENPLFNVDGMLVGVALALTVASGRPPVWLVTVVRSRAALASAVATLILAVVFADLTSWRAAAGLAGAVTATTVVLGHLAVTESWTVRVLRTSPLLWIGKRSYGLYLYHYPLVLLFGVPNAAPGWPRVLASIAAIGLAVIVAAASARWVEAPVRQWVRRRFADGAEGPSAAAALSS